MDETPQWYVLRDLSRPNSKLSAFDKLTGKGIKCFTPLVRKVVTQGGKQEWKDVPYMRDLLFAHSTHDVLDPFMAPGLRLQYRYVPGGFKEPMTVREADMDCFIRAVSSSISPKYYRPEEITPAMRNRRIRIIGGPLHGYEGSLVTVRGTTVKRLLVELPMLLAAAVEVEPEFIQLL